MNIVATIHQPRQEIFDLISQLLLLGPGGRIVYFGPAFEIRHHLCNMRYTCPISSNIADFVMDVLAGFIAADGEAKALPSKEVVATLCDWWTANEYVITRFGINISHQSAAIPSHVIMLSSLLSHFPSPTPTPSPTPPSTLLTLLPSPLHFSVSFHPYSHVVLLFLFDARYPNFQVYIAREIEDIDVEQKNRLAMHDGIMAYFKASDSDKAKGVLQQSHTDSWFGPHGHLRIIRRTVTVAFNRQLKT